MSFVLNQVSTADSYTAANTIENVPACGKVTLDVSAAPIYWSVKLQYPGHPPGGAWGAELYMVTGSKSISRGGITGIRVRSAVAGQPAIVTAELIPVDELT